MGLCKNRFCSIILRCFVAVALLLGIFFYYPFDFRLVSNLWTQPSYLFLAVFFSILAIFANAWRWKILLQKSGAKASFSLITKHLWSSAFLGTFLLGTSAAEIARIALAKQSGLDLDQVTSTVILDRFFGLFAMAIVCIFAGIFATSSETLLLGAFGVGILLIVAVGFLSGEIIMVIGRLLPKQSSVSSFIRRMANALSNFFKPGRGILSQPLSFATPLGLSFATQIFMFLGLYVCSKMLGMDVEHISGLFVAMNAALVSNSIPLTPGGIGVGEVVFEQTYRLFSNADNLASLFFAFRIVRLLAALPGAVMIATYSTRIFDKKGGI